MRQILLLPLLIFLLVPATGFAADVNVRPFLIDEQVTARETLVRDVVLTNVTNRKLSAYATVNEISVGADGEIKEFVSPIMSDRTNTVTSWIEITRGRIELMPGEEKTIPLTFRIHPNPEPGEYHAFIGFGTASKRFEAENQVKAGDANGVVVKLTIEDETEEFLRVSSFLVDRFVMNDDDRTVTVQVENLGDVPETPVGEIIFFSSIGEELAAVPVNTEQVLVQPGETKDLTVEIPLSGDIGRFKANLSLEYGQRQKASLYDTAQFFMLPLPYMLLILAGFVGLFLLIFIVLYRSFTQVEDDHEGTDLPFFVRDGHDPDPKDHDIDLTQNK